MGRKLAMSFVTYNRAKHIQEDLEQIAAPAREKGIDIYIFDGSTNRQTEKVVNFYVEKGYDHIHYLRYENERQRLKDALLLPDAEYIWLCGDKFVILPQNYDTVLTCAEEGFDVITMYGHPLTDTRCFDDPVKYVEYSIIPFTHYGASVIKKDLIKSFDIVRLTKEFPEYWKMLLYIKAIDKEDFKGITICLPKKDLSIQSRFHTRSSSESRMWEIWIEDWYHTIMSFPERYRGIEETLLNRPDRDMHFFCMKALIRQRAEGQFDFKTCMEYKNYIPKVIVLPRAAVFAVSLIPQNIARSISVVFG